MIFKLTELNVLHFPLRVSRMHFSLKLKNKNTANIGFRVYEIKIEQEETQKIDHKD